ncbi:hypothetical protein GCM10020331_098530 [Ectobacillus funiculus]
MPDYLFQIMMSFKPNTYPQKNMVNYWVSFWKNTGFCAKKLQDICSQSLKIREFVYLKLFISKTSVTIKIEIIRKGSFL